MRFLLCLALLIRPVEQPAGTIEIGPRCACSPAEQETARRAGFNAVFSAVGPGTVRIDVNAARIHGAREARLALWKAFVDGARRIAVESPGGLSPEVLALGETAGVITRNEALFAPLVPRARDKTVLVEPAGAVAVHILESPAAIVIVALNHTDRTRRVKLAFPQDIPEAIWQNMEAGVDVSFVMGKDGPFSELTFAPYDALVLAIGKKLR